MSALYIGDCLQVMDTYLEECAVDAVITDPPYHLTSIVKRFGKKGSAEAKGALYRRHSKGFLGQEWDGGDIAFRPETWERVFRVMRPGAYLAAFGGTRTYHRMACAIEDAGFECFDMLHWNFGSGFPKSSNDGKGRGTGLKPAHEPICLARKPREGTYAGNDEKWGTGYMNIDDARVPETISGPCDWTPGSSVKGTKKIGSHDDKGRWPANVVHDGSEEVLSQLPDGAGRFFYTAKPSTREREEGLDDLPSAINPQRSPEAAGSRCGRETTLAHGQNTERKNTHATVKPVALMRWLVRLISPHGGLVLDPFLGSGTTAIAAYLEGREWIGIERDQHYAAIAQARIAHWMRKSK